MCPATPSSKPNREKSRNPAARRSLRWRRSSSTVANCGGLGMANISSAVLCTRPSAGVAITASMRERQIVAPGLEQDTNTQYLCTCDHQIAPASGGARDRGSVLKCSQFERDIACDASLWSWTQVGWIDTICYGFLPRVDTKLGTAMNKRICGGLFVLAGGLLYIFPNTDDRASSVAFR